MAEPEKDSKEENSADSDNYFTVDSDNMTGKAEIPTISILLNRKSLTRTMQMDEEELQDELNTAQTATETAQIDDLDDDDLPPAPPSEMSRTIPVGADMEAALEAELIQAEADLAQDHSVPAPPPSKSPPGPPQAPPPSKSLPPRSPDGEPPILSTSNAPPKMPNPPPLEPPAPPPGPAAQHDADALSVSGIDLGAVEQEGVDQELAIENPEFDPGLPSDALQTNPDLVSETEDESAPPPLGSPKNTAFPIPPPAKKAPTAPLKIKPAARSGSQEPALVIWNPLTLRKSRDPIGKVLLELGGQGLTGALFLVMLPIEPGQKAPVFRASAATGQTDMHALWQGLKWDPQFSPKIWNSLIKCGFDEIHPNSEIPGSVLVREAFGARNDEFLSLARVGPVQQCRGLLAFYSSGPLAKHLGQTHQSLEKVVSNSGSDKKAA